MQSISCKAPLLFTCPNCNILVEIAALNCGVFRCAVYKSDGMQVDPHLSRAECEALGDTIYGCGNPFQIINGRIVKFGWT